MALLTRTQASHKSIGSKVNFVRETEDHLQIHQHPVRHIHVKFWDLACKEPPKPNLNHNNKHQWVLKSTHTCINLLWLSAAFYMVSMILPVKLWKNPWHVSVLGIIHLPSPVSSGRRCAWPPEVATSLYSASSKFCLLPLAALKTLFFIHSCTALPQWRPSSQLLRILPAAKFFL